VSRRGKPSVDRFSLKLRETIGKYSDGVHRLGAPASVAAIAAVGLPASAHAVYQLADGLDLFGDVMRLLPLARIERSADGFEIGEAEGERLVVVGDGAIDELDEDGDRLRVADDLETALVIYLAREGLLVGNDGEWKEVFGDDGEIVPSVRKKRNEAGRKRAPEASRWLVEAAELAIELDGDEDEAIALCREARDCAPAAEMLGVLVTSRGELAEGAAALAVAAEHSGHARKAERSAAAAAAMLRAGDEAEQKRLAAMAVAAEPGIAARLSAEADAALDDGRMDDADRLGSLASALGATLSVQARTKLKLRST
jgi:hypothetical protein